MIQVRPFFTKPPGDIDPDNSIEYMIAPKDIEEANERRFGEAVNDTVDVREKPNNESGFVLTTPISETSYTGQYPDMPEFKKPWEGGVHQVGPGGGKLSKDQKPLQSEGFDRGIAMALKNKANGDVALFHIADIDLEGHQEGIVEEFMARFLDGLELDPEIKRDLLSASNKVSHYKYPRSMKREPFQKAMEMLNKDGVLKAHFVFGSDSRYVVKGRIIGSLLSYLGIQVEDDICADTGDRCWHIVCKPSEGQILVDAKNQKKVLEFEL